MQATRSGDARNIGLAAIGAALEYYDFIVYVYVASTLSQAFFPPGTSEFIQELQVFAIFAVGYLIRPLAGLVIAHLADRLGRKRMFVFTVMLMSIPTFLMGLLPTYGQVGWLAPLLLLLLRIAQGCAVGGELPGAAVFVSEHVSPRRLLSASGSLHGIVFLGLILGAGSAILASMVAELDPGLAQLAWRLPFLLGGGAGLLAAYLRRHLEETPQFLALREQREASRRVPLVTVVRQHWRACLVGLLLMFNQSLTSAVLYQFLQAYLIGSLHVPRTAASSATLVGIAVFTLSLPAWGWLADRIGVGVMLAGTACVSLGTAVWTLNGLPASSPPGLLVLVPVSLTAGGVTAVLPGVVASLFPTAVRQTGYALPYNLGAAVFAGPALLVLAWAVRLYGLPAALVVFGSGCVTAVVAAVMLRSQPRFLGLDDAAEPAPLLGGDVRLG